MRPFGVSLLIAGWDKTPGRPLLFQCDPSGAYFAWKATALGKNDVNAKTFLEKRFNETLELDDGIHTSLLTLRESFDVGMTEDNVEVLIYLLELAELFLPVALFFPLTFIVLIHPKFYI